MAIRGIVRWVLWRLASRIVSTPGTVVVSVSSVGAVAVSVEPV